MWSKFNFLHVGIYFDRSKCEFSLKNSSLTCWFLPIFVVDTEILFVYDFVAPLIVAESKC